MVEMVEMDGAGGRRGIRRYIDPCLTVSTTVPILKST